MARILSGLRVMPRKDAVVEMITGEPNSAAAFSTGEVITLGEELSKALAQASSKELVTFYRRMSDADVGLGVTSGGIFVDDHLLYVIVANHRNRPADVMSQAVMYEFDPIDDPLLSLRAKSFSLAFVPARAVAERQLKQRWRYMDPGKIVVIDLQRLEPSQSINRQ